MTGFIIKVEILQMLRFEVGVLLLAMSLPVLYAYMRLFLVVEAKGNLKFITIFACSIGLV